MPKVNINKIYFYISQKEVKQVQEHTKPVPKLGYNKTKLIESNLINQFLGLKIISKEKYLPAC